MTLMAKRGYIASSPAGRGRATLGWCGSVECHLPTVFVITFDRNAQLSDVHARESGEI
jgi:hypothetical protein